MPILFLTIMKTIETLYSPWNSPGQNTGLGSLSLLQGIFLTQGSNQGLPQCRWRPCAESKLYCYPISSSFRGHFCCLVYNILLISHHVLFPLFGGFGREAIYTLWSPSIYMIWHHLSPGSECLELTSPCSLLSLSKFQVPCLLCDFRFLMVSSGNHESEVFPVGKMLFSASHIS